MLPWRGVGSIPGVVTILRLVFHAIGDTGSPSAGFSREAAVHPSSPSHIRKEARLGRGSARCGAAVGLGQRFAGMVHGVDLDVPWAMSSSPIRLTPRLCRAARALLGWRQADLAAASGVPEPTVNAFEAKPEAGRMIAANARLLVTAFEAAGTEFIPENGGGAGLKVRKAGGGSSVAAKG